MLKKIIVGLGLSLSFLACMGAPEEAGIEDEGAVDSAEQAIRTSVLDRTYFSDSSFTTEVGWLIRDCDPEGDNFEGIQTAYYKDRRDDCPSYNSPLLPSTNCWVCSSPTSCTLTACP